MTTLLVMIIVLVVISLALDVLILATLGNLIKQLLNIDARGISPATARKAVAKAVAEAVAEAVSAMQAQAERIPHYDA